MNKQDFLFHIYGVAYLSTGLIFCIIALLKIRKVFKKARREGFLFLLISYYTRPFQDLSENKYLKKLRNDDKQQVIFLFEHSRKWFFIIAGSFMVGIIVLTMLIEFL